MVSLLLVALQPLVAPAKAGPIETDGLYLVPVETTADGAPKGLTTRRGNSRSGRNNPRVAPEAAVGDR